MQNSAAGDVDRYNSISFDEADVAAAFDAAFLDFRDIVVVQTQAHILFDIMNGNVITMHRA
jgi:hypothetical protein